MEDNQIVDEPKIYQALGIISGILELKEERYSSLLIGEETHLVTVSKKVWKNHQPGQLENFKIYPIIVEGKLGFKLRLVIEEVRIEAGIILKGCWEIHEEEPRLVIYRNSKSRSITTKTVLPLNWKEAPVADGQYWEIEAQLKGDKFEVTQAVGPFDAPRKYQKWVKKKYINAKSDLPRPILRSERYTNIKSELPPPILRSAKTEIAVLEPKEIELPEEKGRASEPIALSGSIEENNRDVKAADVIEPVVTSESKGRAESVSEESEPEAKELSPVVTEDVTPKKKKASSKSTVSRKLSITEGGSEAIEPENEEAKKTKAKSSSLKKQKSLAGDRIFLGKQLPPGK
jgi:hypothetical protein